MQVLLFTAHNAMLSVAHLSLRQRCTTQTTSFKQLKNNSSLQKHKNTQENYYSKQKKHVSMVIRREQKKLATRCTRLRQVLAAGVGLHHPAAGVVLASKSRGWTWRDGRHPFAPLENHRKPSCLLGFAGESPLSRVSSVGPTGEMGLGEV